MKRAVAAIAFFVAVAAAGQTAPPLRGYWYPPNNVVVIYWSSVPGATRYHVYRTSAFSTWEDWGLYQSTFVVISQLANTAFVYQIQPENNAGPIGPVSNRVLITTYGYTDEPIVANSTKVRPVHITDLRTAINAARAAAGLQAATWTRPTLTTIDKIQAQDVSELRVAFDAALQNIGLTALPMSIRR